MLSKNNNLIKQYSVSASAILLSGLFSQGSNYLSLMIVSRIIGKTGFGILTVVQYTTLALVGIGSMLTGIATTKLVAQNIESNPHRVGRLLGLLSWISLTSGLVFSGVLFFFSDFIANNFLNKPFIGVYLKLGSIIVFFQTQNIYQLGCITGLSAFHLQAKISAIQGVFQLILVTILTIRFGLVGTIISFSATALTNWFHFNRAIKNEISKYGVSISYRSCLSEFQALRDIIVPGAISTVIYAVSIWLSQSMLIRTASGILEIAQFNAVNQIRSITLQVPAILTRVLSPVLCKLYSQNQSDSYLKIFRINLVTSTVVGGLGAIVLGLLAPSLLNFFGKTFTTSSLLIVFMMAWGFFEILSSVLYLTVITHDRLWWQTGFSVIWALILIVTAFFLTPKFGAKGLALANLTAWLFAFFAYGFSAYYLLIRAVTPQKAR